MNGMPKVLINFSEKAVSAIKRSSKGTIALIVKDDTNSFEVKEYGSFAEVQAEHWKEKNYKNIERVFKGLPKKLYVLRIAEGTEGTSEAYSKLLMKRVDYLSYPEANEAEKTALSSFFLNQKNESIKLVMSGIDADNENVINVTMGIITETETVSKEDMTARIAGILGGISQEISSTYYVISEAKNLIQEEIPADYDVAVNEGKLVFINDGVKVKIARGVNSLRTLTETKGHSYKKIKLVEAMDMIKRDIKDTFEDEYAGKTLNEYINKIQFIGAINIYFKELTKVGILDRSFENKAEINMEEQLNYIKLNSSLTEDEISELEEQDIKEWNTGSTVFLNGKIKLTDTMEDLVFPIEL